MRILELNFEKGWRGGERQTMYTLAGFNQAGVQVELLCRKNTPLEQYALAEGYTVHAFNNIFGVIAFLILKVRRFDVLHAQTSQILTYCVFTKLFHGSKVMYTRRVAFGQKSALTRYKYRLTDILVAISIAVKTNLENFTGRKDVTVIPDAVVSKELNSNRASQLLGDLGVPKGKHIIGTIAVIEEGKDPLSMVEAIKLLAEKRNDFVFLHFGNGPMEQAVRQKVKECNLENIYLLPGFQNDIEDFFSIFEIFVMSSIKEGMGSSVLDAFVYKVPVVSTDAGGLKDLIADGRAIMCRMHAPQMIADSIALLLNDPNLKAQLVNSAFNYAIKEHSIDAVTEKYIRLLK